MLLYHILGYIALFNATSKIPLEKLEPDTLESSTLPSFHRARAARIDVVEPSASSELEDGSFGDRSEEIPFPSSTVNPVLTETTDPTLWETLTNGTDPRNSQGLLVGTYSGLYVVKFLQPSNPILLSPTRVQGLAFDWNSKKVYWAVAKRGLYRANLDGSGEEKLLADPDVRGVAIEPITGNLYYGSWTKGAITVCNNDADRCATVVSTYNVYDIALHLSKGFLFWSSWGSSLNRVNLDSTGKKTLVSEHVYGISVDQFKDRLYWFFYEDDIKIKTSDLNGSHAEVLSTKKTYAGDVEIDGDKIFYSMNGESDETAIAQIYYKIKDQDLGSTLLTELSDKGRYLALFGTSSVVPKANNPCQGAKCAHLCILTAETSYRCVCPDHQHLLTDGVSCGHPVQEMGVTHSPYDDLSSFYDDEE